MCTCHLFSYTVIIILLNIMNEVLPMNGVILVKKHRGFIMMLRMIQISIVRFHSLLLAVITSYYSLCLYVKEMAENLEAVLVKLFLILLFHLLIYLLISNLKYIWLKKYLHFIFLTFLTKYFKQICYYSKMFERPHLKKFKRQKNYHEGSINIKTFSKEAEKESSYIPLYKCSTCI